MNARGVALVSGLVLLAAVSLLALTAAGGMALQVQQAANYQDRLRADTVADAAQAAALSWLYSRPDSDRQDGCIEGCFLPAAIRPAGTLPLQPEFLSTAWWRANATATGDHPETGEPLDAGVSAEPGGWWIAEEVHFEAIDASGNASGIAGVGYYRILARGLGRQSASVAVTETVAARPWQGEYEPSGYPPVQALREYCRQFDPAVPCGVLSWRILR